MLMQVSIFENYNQHHHHNNSVLVVSMDVMDVSGEQQNELHTSIFKVRLDPMGLPLIVQKNPVSSKDKEISKFCGDCYGASHGCCNSCDEVLFAYRQKDWTVKSLGDFEQVRCI